MRFACSSSRLKVELCETGGAGSEAGLPISPNHQLFEPSSDGRWTLLRNYHRYAESTASNPERLLHVPSQHSTCVIQRIAAVLIMDDYELERIGSDNPAQSVPAAQRVPPDRQRSTGFVDLAEKRPGEFQKKKVADASLTKYDVCISAPTTTCLSRA